MPSRELTSSPSWRDSAEKREHGINFRQKKRQMRTIKIPQKCYINECMHQEMKKELLATVLEKYRGSVLLFCLLKYLPTSIAIIIVR